jgi:hypothetical protein
VMMRCGQLKTGSLFSRRSKLGAKNRTHAVCRAIELGIS